MRKTPSCITLSLSLVLSACTSFVLAQELDSSEFYFQKGVEAKTAKRFLVASSFFETAIRFNPQYKEAYLESGYINLAMSKPDKAMSQFNKVIDLEPTNLAATKELMELCYNYRQFTKAIEMANRCSGCSGADKIKAMCCYNSEDYGKAVTELTNYLAKNPEDAEASYALAKSYFNMGNYKNAIPFYHKAILLNGEKNTWFYELGFLYYDQQDYKNAAVFLNKAGEKGYPRDKDFIEALGYAYIFSGQQELGERLLQELLEKRSGDPELIFGIAETLYKSRMFQKSLDYCQQLMQLNRQNGKALYLAGLCFQKMGEKEKGQGMCDKAIELDPSLNSLRKKLMTEL